MSEAAFRASLQARLRARAAGSSWSQQELTRAFALQQFSARLFRSEAGQRWVLTGGTALQYRTAEARPTADADLAARSESGDLLAELQAATQPAPGEPGEFRLTITAGRTPGIHTGSLLYLLDGRRFANASIDITVDRPMSLPPDLLTPEPVVAVDGLPELPSMRVYPVALHLADKIAAMYEHHGPDGTTPSTRPHDLADIIILSRSTSVDAAVLRAAVTEQEQRRGITVPVPLTIPNPDWERTYRERVRHTALPPDLHDLAAALAEANRFLAPALSGAAGGAWDPTTGGWAPSAPSIGNLIQATRAERKPQTPSIRTEQPEAPPPDLTAERDHGYDL
ncbi:MAG: nucleotidyl transferase AbiEii/AbiGii toxin family protein [Gordonia polyisoprenivorans]|nr:nucleotidyl transferase AbiEii/AbiGii toxin family protein [Gordonia polyisoprenivorans]